MVKACYGIAGGFKRDETYIPPLDRDNVGFIVQFPPEAVIYATEDLPIELEVFGYPDVRGPNEPHTIVMSRIVRKQKDGTKSIIYEVVTPLHSLIQRPYLYERTI